MPSTRRSFGICADVNIWLVKPGTADRPHVNLAVHPALFGSTSVVVPCHNEQMNVRPLIDACAAYDAYIHEIIIVDDNSTDDTAAVVREAMKLRSAGTADPSGTPPNGVGRALRDGYAAVTGATCSRWTVTL